MAINLEIYAKSSYIGIMRALDTITKPFGLRERLERNSQDSDLRHWFASLFSIYDIDGLIKLDVPWWVYGAIHEVDRFLASKPCRVFEYGSGASTAWLAKRSQSVVSIEHDKEWFDLVSSKLRSLPTLNPVDLRHVPAPPDPTASSSFRSQKAGALDLDFEAYAKSILSEEQRFDLIVIDGRVREACLDIAVTHLEEEGLIVFDNSHRKRYKEAIVNSGLKAQRYSGLTPALPYFDETTILSGVGST